LVLVVAFVEVGTAELGLVLIWMVEFLHSVMAKLTLRALGTGRSLAVLHVSDERTKLSLVRA